MELGMREKRRNTAMLVSDREKITKREDERLD